MVKAEGETCMAYLPFISDEHLFAAIGKVYDTYSKAYHAYDKFTFNRNIVDPFEMVFSTRFRRTSDDEWIKNEAERQIGKTVSNAIGTFQEEILGFAPGFTKYKVGDPEAHGMDIMNDQRTILADIKNKHNTVKGGDKPQLFRELVNAIGYFPNSTAYYVQVIAKGSFNKPWAFDSRGKRYSHPNVRIISGDRFYELLFGTPTAFHDLIQILPEVLKDYVEDKGTVFSGGNFKLLGQLSDDMKETGAGSLYDVIANSSFKDYLGFKKQ